jgi:hypothetical protein
VFALCKPEFRHKNEIFIVIPAQAGIHFDFREEAAKSKARWIPACAGMTI